MAVQQVVAKMYDAQGSRPRKASTSEKGFDEAVNKAVENESREVCGRCVRSTDISPTLVSHKIDDADAENTAQSSEATSDAENGVEAVSEQEVSGFAAFRFSIFISTSSQLVTAGNSLLDRFQSATRELVGSLQNNDDYGLNLFDGFLGHAQQAVSDGQSESMKLIDEMLQAADNGLKAVNASLDAAGMMNGFNLSMNSALPGTSAADIAGIRLQEAMKTGSFAGGGQTSTGLSESRGYGLKLIKSAVSAESTSHLALTPAQESDPAIKDKVLARFLEMFDSILPGHKRQDSSARNEIYFSMHLTTEGREAKETRESSTADKEAVKSDVKEVVV